VLLKIIYKCIVTQLAHLKSHLSCRINIATEADNFQWQGEGDKSICACVCVCVCVRVLVCFHLCLRLNVCKHFVGRWRHMPLQQNKKKKKERPLKTMPLKLCTLKNTRRKLTPMCARSNSVN